ncbi:MAG: ABC transporter substrate-binding protein [Petrotogales bacterium]
MKKLLILSVFLLIGLMALSASGKLEIFSWWTAGGEEEGLFALYDVFHEHYPDVEIINATVAGGAGTNAKAVLKTRMLGGNPPDSFQVHAGAELNDTYVVTGLMEPITPFLEEWGIMDKFPKDILDICSYEGEVYSVPVNIHRGNVMFYSKEIVEEVGIDTVPTTWPEFIETLKNIEDAGYIPLALGDKNKWTAAHLFESVLLGILGPYQYNGLWDGRVSFENEGVKKALEVFRELMEYVNNDHSALAWQDATRLLYEKQAAFNVMGDWAEGYLKTLGWKPEENFGWMALPSTRGSFMIVSDTFGLPKNAPNRSNAIRWLKVISSVEAQDAFNPIKGSIPARVDANPDLYDVYLQWSMEDFKTNALCPSIAHGSAAPEAFTTALNDIINRFISTGNVDEAWNSLVEAAEESL